MSNNEFDFANKPLGYRIADGFKSKFGKKESKPSNEFERMVYFKTESMKTVVGDIFYLVCYTDSGFVAPQFSQAQLSKMIKAKKGYVGYKQEHDKEYGIKNVYVVQPLERAHSYPTPLNLERLISQNKALLLK